MFCSRLDLLLRRPHHPTRICNLCSLIDFLLRFHLFLFFYGIPIHGGGRIVNYLVLKSILEITYVYLRPSKI